MFNEWTQSEKYILQIQIVDVGYNINLVKFFNMNSFGKQFFVVVKKIF